MSGSQWVRIDVGYLTNPKIRRAGRDAALLHLAAVCYLGAHENENGLLPPEALELLAPQCYIRHVEPVIERLVKNGLWHPSLDGGFLIHDYDLLNGAKSEAAGARRRQRKRRAEARAAAEAEENSP